MTLNSAKLADTSNLTLPDDPDSATFLEQQDKIIQASQFHWIHWVIILASFLVTMVAWQYAKVQNDTQVAERFNRETGQVVDLIADRMKKYEDVLWGAVAATKSSPDGMTLDRWERFSAALKIEMAYPGINGIGLIDYLRPEDLDDYLALQRDTRPDYKVFPAHNRGEFLPITFIEPVASNSAAVGLDVAHEDNRYTAAMKARDTGEAQITGPIILVQDARKTPGFLFYAPNYAVDNPTTLTERRDTFTGMAYAPFIFERLMDGALGNEQRRVGLTIRDGDDVLFDEKVTDREGRKGEPAYTTSVIQDMHGRSWTYDIWSRPAFEATAINNKPLIILGGGILVEILLVGLFILLTRSNRRAILFANKMSAVQQSQAKRLNNILENAVEGIMTLSSDGKVLSYNKACESIFGYEFSAIKGKDVKILIPQFWASYAVIQDNKRSISNDNDGNNAHKSSEATGLKFGRTQVPLELSVSEITDDGQMIYNAIVRDITRQKKAETERNSAMENLLLTNQDLEMFAYSASHDLKSPLRSIDNLSQWIAEDIDDKIDDETRERLAMLRGRVKRMEGLLNSLLQYSRAGKNKIGGVEIMANTLVADVSNALDIPDGMTLIIDDSLSGIDVRRMPLEQIFHNLISNAFKHHDKPNGIVTVSATVTDDNYIFKVSDNGPGIPVDFQEKVFGMFQTLKPRDMVEGTGMGLALVKKLVRYHNGHIDLISTPGKGSDFVVTWPKLSAVKAAA